jgi:hypothetical protein
MMLKALSSSSSMHQHQHPAPASLKCSKPEMQFVKNEEAEQASSAASLNCNL